MRRICTAGYMNALLFQKDLETVYDAYKYCLEDPQLSGIVRSEQDILSAYQHHPLAFILKQQQHQIIDHYLDLVPELDPGSDENDLFENHIDKLCEINASLDHQLVSRQRHLIGKLNVA
ncbi:hypothetical protein [Dyadobacter alkalitolerans]|uniref:hypothetical protein n=1 Tax=Dyadobacter alkalitolerans TaxID=492736 RepID=UPI0003FAE144|nr:hypothetical protein [Dyadobacter alkalitolerans]